VLSEESSIESILSALRGRLRKKLLKPKNAMTAVMGYTAGLGGSKMFVDEAGLYEIARRAGITSINKVYTLPNPNVGTTFFLVRPKTPLITGNDA